MDSQSQGKRMCLIGESDYGLYDEDSLSNLNMWDFPGYCLEGDVGLPDDFGSEFGPIPLPSELLLPPVGRGSLNDLISLGTNIETFEPKYNPNPTHNKEPIKSHLKPQPSRTFPQQKKNSRIPKSFEAPSPDSVLEGRNSTSSQKTISLGQEITFPVKSRTKRPKPKSTANLWSKITFQKKTKKSRKSPSPQQPTAENKKCSHCEITQTPQWREGPMGPKTLCNACGVRYRSGRLFPEYRPAASPTFIPNLHSNSHRKVIEMRQKGSGMDDVKFVAKKDFNSISTNGRVCL